MMKSKQFLAMMLAAMLAVGSAAVPAFAAENTSETEEADQVSEAVFEEGIMDGNLSAEEESSDKMLEEQEEAQSRRLRQLRIPVKC